MLRKKEDDVGYNIQIIRTTAMVGEQISITTNAPKDADAEGLMNKIRIMTDALEMRLSECNDKVLERTGKNLEELGLADKIPGFGKKGNGEARE